MGGRRREGRSWEGRRGREGREGFCRTNQNMAATALCKCKKCRLCVGVVTSRIRVRVSVSFFSVTTASVFY